MRPARRFACKILNFLTFDPDKHVWLAHELPQIPGNDNIGNFVQYLLSLYSTEPWSENPLSLYSGIDFEMFLLDMFGVVREETGIRLKNLVEDKVVNFEKRRDVLTLDRLYAATQDEFPRPVEESEGLSQDNHHAPKKRI